MTKKPTTVKEWEKVCNNLNKALESMIADEVILKAKITGLEEEVKELEKELDAEIDEIYDEHFAEHAAEIEKLEEQLTMTVGVVKYLEMKLERLNPVRGN